MEQWFYMFFPGERLEKPYPAVRIGKKTYVFSKMSDLDALREKIKANPPEPIVVPVIAIDCAIPENPPSGEWLGLSSTDFRKWNYRTKLDTSCPVSLEAFTMTVEMMSKLP